MAVARGQAVALTHGGTTIVICTGYGVMTVALDDQGNPIGPVHPCPDCLAGMATYLSPNSVVILPVASLGQKAVVFAPVLQPRAATGRMPRVRGPPLIG
jgi:hypothetical protein